MAETSTPKYSRELLQDSESRLANKEKLSKEKIGEKRLIETDDGKKALAMKWMDKANLGEAGKKAVLDEIGVNTSMNSTEFIKQVARWQEENGLADPGKGDGIIGWKTLEVADNEITRKLRSDDDWNSDGSREDTGLAEIEKDERETQEIQAGEAKTPGTDQYKSAMNTILATAADQSSGFSGVVSPDGREINSDYEGNKLFLRDNNGNTYNNDSGTWGKKADVSLEKLQLRDKSGKSVDLKKGEINTIDGTDYFVDENNDIIAIRQTKTQRKLNVASEYYQKLTTGNDGKKTWETIDEKNLSTDTTALIFEKRYGDWTDSEWSGDKKFRDLKIGDLARAAESDSGNSLSRSAAKQLLSKLSEDAKMNTKINELTLSEYTKFKANPDDFGQSRFMTHTKNGGRLNPRGTTESVGFVDPGQYGIDAKGYEYARSGDVVIKRPKAGANIDTIMIAGKDGKFESQRNWLQRVKVTPDTEYSVYGMPDLRFKKGKNGEVYVYNANETTKPLEQYVGDKWAKPKGTT